MWKKHINHHVEELLLPSIFYPQPRLPVLSVVFEHIWDVHTGSGNRTEELRRAYALHKWLSAARGGYLKWILLKWPWLSLWAPETIHPSPTSAWWQYSKSTQSWAKFQLCVVLYLWSLKAGLGIVEITPPALVHCEEHCRKTTEGNEQFWALGQNLQQIIHMRIVNVQANQNHWPTLHEIRERRVGAHLKVHSVERKKKMLAMWWRTWLYGEPKLGMQGRTELLHWQTLQSWQDNPHILCTFKILQITLKRKLKCLAWVFLKNYTPFPVIHTNSFRATWQKL